MTPAPLELSVRQFLQHALDEDLGTGGDITSQAIFGADDLCRARIASKASGVLSGASLISSLFGLVDNRIACSEVLSDGSRLSAGTVIARLAGPVRGVLAGERVMLNILQRLSGVATMSARMVEAMKPHRATLLDTRKTTPGMRALEKKAVVDGGGSNHRFGLFDMVLIKDTHVKAVGGVGEAIRRVRATRPGMPAVKIEAEVQDEEQFHEALAEKPDIIMLDNMSCERIAACVAEARGSGVLLEASGNVSLETIGAVAATGVDFVSVGSVTHSAPALDIHLVIE